MELSCGAAVTIMLTGVVDEAAQFAKEELASHLKAMFAKLQIVEKKGDVRITLTVRESPMLKYDGYQVIVTEKEARITAKMGRGVLHGVYHFLRMVGCSFWFSKASCQNVPTLRRKTLVPSVYTANPFVEKRGICLLGLYGKNVADVLATIDFMAKNGYNLLVTSWHTESPDQMQEHDIFWDEIRETVLPHIIKRGIEICIGIGTDKLPTNTVSPPISLEDTKSEDFAKYLDETFEFVKDKPYVSMLGLWSFAISAKQCEENSEMLKKAYTQINDTAKNVQHDISVLHIINRFSCDKTAAQGKGSALLIECDRAYDCANASKEGEGTFLLDREMGDSYYYNSNLWVQPHACKQLIASAANAGCKGIISLWSPMSAWWVASLNFSMLSEAYYHPDFSVPNILDELASDLWGPGGAPLAKALRHIISNTQDKSIWSRPPQSVKMQDHIANRNEVFDKHNAIVYEKRYQETMALIGSVSIARLDEHARYHLDCLKAYIDIQRQYFHCIDQYYENSPTDTIKPYLKMLDTTKEKIGEGFLRKKYADWCMNNKGMFDTHE